MLILSRRTRQSVMIGEDIVITVLSTDGDFVRLGIEAPRHMTILRHELVQAVSQENQRARVQQASPTAPADEQRALSAQALAETLRARGTSSTPVSLTAGDAPAPMP